MKGLIYAIVVVAVLALLVVTNPTSEDYESYLKAEFIKESNAESEVSQALASTFGAVASNLLSSVTVRNDYILFSTYSAGSGDTERLTLGLLGNFFVLKDGE